MSSVVNRLRRLFGTHATPTPPRRRAADTHNAPELHECCRNCSLPYPKDGFTECWDCGSRMCDDCLMSNEPLPKHRRRCACRRGVVANREPEPTPRPFDADPNWKCSPSIDDHLHPIN